MCQACEILRSHASPRNIRPGSSGLPRPCRGVTLLELMLALGLTAVVLVLISQAVRLHLTVFDVGRSEVEQPQVARAVLRYIAADLRNAVRPSSTQTSGTGPSTAATNPSTTKTPAASQGAMGGQKSTGSSSTQKATTSQNASTSKNLNTTASAASSVPPVNGPGLYGSQYELQIDVSRPPRVDQYTQASGPSSVGGTVDIPSAVKTVSYSLKTDGTTGASGGTAPTSGEGTTGLFRRELDRGVASYASTGNSGSGDSSSGTGDGSGQLLAAEVNRLEFRYFDGSSWCTEWDSQQQGGLPQAVEITLGIDPAAGVNASAGTATAAPGSASADTDEFTYRLVVRLPVAEQSTTTGASTSETGLGAMEP